VRGVRRKGKAYAQLLDTREISRRTDRENGNVQSWSGGKSKTKLFLLDN
jgi:hypothetical protein